MFKNNKILINISNIEDIKKYKEVGITHFLFPLENFSVGYETFSLETIKKTGVKAYLLINRLLTDDDIDEFLKLEMPKNVQGLFIEDTGLFYALKQSHLEKINFQNHLNNNFKTVNYWLRHFDSLMVSTDITKEEVDVILKNADKPLIIYTFGYPEIMYSRRCLLKNYYEHLGEKPKKSIEVTIPNNELSLILKESPLGTVAFPNTPLDAREEALAYDEDKVKFYLFDTNMIDKEKIIEALNGSSFEDVQKGFLHRKTIYRIGDIK